MPQARREPMAIAPRHLKPPGFSGTLVQWRSLCDVYPSAETPEILLAVIEYCTVRQLDPYKKPVHVVPMWNSRLGRRVQVVMPGINEIEITAARTGEWCGMDEPVYGPDETRTFRGPPEEDPAGERKSTEEVTLTFPVSCAVPVYRIVKGIKARFVEPVYWIEAYGRASFRSELPNARWSQAPRQMLHKCAKAAVLRAAFPEQGLGYVAEEMEDREVESGGVTIDGNTDYGQGGDSRARDPPPPEGIRKAAPQAATRAT